MWRTYVICVLVGLLLVSTGSNIWMTRLLISQQSDSDKLRARLTAAETQQNRLQQQLDQLQTSGAVPRPTPSTAPGVPVPTLGTAGGVDRAVLQQIEDDVAGLRGLAPLRDVQLRFLDQSSLQRFFVDRFNQDYLPSERESDQKLLATLGMIDPNESVVQTLLDVLQEQVIGVYNQDDKVMYLVADHATFGPDEKDTFAHEFTHALQDQYYDLTRLAPKHPANDDRALAISALAEGDAVLIQRLWAQDKLSQTELSQLGQGGSGSKLFSAPLFLREQLLFPYSDGFNFVRQIYQTQGGYPALDEVFKNPPESTEQILHPEKYRAHEKPIDVSLADLSLTLGPGWRKINSNVLGELDLRLILQQLTDRTRAVRGASGWGGDRWQLLEKDGKQAFVLKSVWDSENEAKTFFETMGLGLKNRFFGAKEEEASASRQALTATNSATELRRDGVNVLLVISFDRPTAEAVVAALGP
ncbi:MAG TPA: hypothetical protein VGQ62_02425 [Chloroflexota bacterium]|nr:hypothetical protein [Chloroflexota bacterium]